MENGGIFMVIWYEGPVPIVQTRHSCVDALYYEKLPPGIKRVISKGKTLDTIFWCQALKMFTNKGGKRRRHLQR